MTAEEAIKTLRDIKLGIFIDTYFDEAEKSVSKENEVEKSVSKENEALEIAIEALEQQPCEDCISRQEAISAIQDEYYADAVGIDIVDIIAHLPSVTPKAESRNVLAEIKAEIEQKCCITVGSDNEPAITLYDVFQIIDKYRKGGVE